MGADAVEYIAEILKWVNLTQLAACNQAIDDSSPFGTGITPGEEPIFASKCPTIRRTRSAMLLSISRGN